MFQYIHLIYVPASRVRFTHYQGTAFPSFTFHFSYYCNIHKTVTKQSNIIVKQYYCINKRLKKLNIVTKKQLCRTNVIVEQYYCIKK